jgi:DNA-binding NarL/FixJ family response regulator
MTKFPREHQAVTTVLLADEQTIDSEALASLLKDSFEIAGIVHDGRQLIEAAQTLRPSVIVTDIAMPVLNGLDAVRRLPKAGVDSKVIVVTHHREIKLAIEAFRAGVSGYLLKQSASEELVRAIHEVMQDRVYLTSLIAKDLIQALLAEGLTARPGAPLLTGRQREILQLVAEGKTAKEIASILDISARTAQGHKYEIMRIFRVRTSAELVHLAIKLGLISS